MKLKENFYGTIVRHVLLYGAKCCTTKKEHANKTCGENANV